MGDKSCHLVYFAFTYTIPLVLSFGVFRSPSQGTFMGVMATLHSYKTMGGNRFFFFFQHLSKISASTIDDQNEPLLCFSFNDCYGALVMLTVVAKDGG